DTVRVELQGIGIALLTLELAITTPQDGEVVCADSVLVEGRVSVSGGLPPLAMACEVNGISANVSDSSFSATVPVGFGETLLVASCTVIDSLGTKVSSRDSMRISRTLPPSCLVEIVSPRDSATVNSDSVQVTAVTTVVDGTPPFIMHCTINGATAAVADTSFSATIPLVIGENEIVATCTVVDSCGNQTVCSDTITVFRPQVEISCQVEIVSPLDNSLVCADSITVAGKLEIANAASPLKIACEVNGRPAVVTDTSFVAVVPVSSGDNLLVATCTIVDSLGRKATCSDSVSVFRDDIAPTCTFSDEGSFVTGTFFDLESGIFEIKAVKLKNATLSVEPFAVGADSVNFRVDAIDPNQPKGFSIDVVDVCGNEFNCDPILFTLTTDRSSRQFEFSFYSTERYFRLTNHGLTEIRVDLNGNKFTLLTTPNLAEQKLNAFVMPTEGTITIDMQPYLQEAENSLWVAFHGAAGTSADLMLVDDVQEVDYVLDLDEVPADFQLLPNYPNPFNPSTTIDYQLPQASRVSLKIYNLRGQQIRTLFDGRQQAGVHSLVWDGKNDHGETVASGIYVVRLVASDATAGKRPDFVQSRKMALVK
ncbi:MAG: FlgD immunoglobulin-like domain containing protein, partial [bacterium]